jgi:hypothetical protein
VRPTWWKRQTATIDAFVAGGVTLCLFWWFGQLLQLAGTIALYAGVFGAFQLMRFVGAQLAELQWVRLHEAVLREKKPPAAPAAGADGYRQAAVIEEPFDPEDDGLADEVRRRGRRATTSLAIAGAAVWAASVAIGGVVVPTLLAALVATFAFAVRAWRRHEAKRRDFFMQHLERDTTALLEPKRRVRVADTQLRAGVDFGVPATALDESEAASEADATPRAARAQER